jgi:hypothetical protein
VFTARYELNLLNTGEVNVGVQMVDPAANNIPL